jgi:hypothetical protein
VRLSFPGALPYLGGGAEISCGVQRASRVTNYLSLEMAGEGPDPAPDGAHVAPLASATAGGPPTGGPAEGAVGQNFHKYPAREPSSQQRNGETNTTRYNSLDQKNTPSKTSDPRSIEQR